MPNAAADAGSGRRCRRRKRTPTPEARLRRSAKRSLTLSSPLLLESSLPFQMLRRPKPFEPFSPFLSLALHLLKSARFSSNPYPNPKTLKTLTRSTPRTPKLKHTIKPSGPSSHRRPLAAPPQLSYNPNPPPLKPSSPDAESICSLISKPSDQPLDLDALLNDFKGKLTSDLVLEILKNYRRLGRSKTLKFFSWAGSQLGFRLDDPLVEYVADFLGRRKLFDDLKCLLRTVSSHRGRVSTRTVAICIRFLGRQGRVVEALALFEVMESEFSCPPDNLVFNNVLYVLCKIDLSDNSIEIALTIFRRIRQPDVYSYSNILVGLCRLGRLDDALEVFDKMGRANLAPTRTAANSLIGQLCELGGKDELVGKVRVDNTRRPFDILVPNLRAKSGIQPAVEVFWVISKLGLLPSMHIVNRLISELCEFGSIEEAIEIMKVVEDRKLGCIDECYSTVVRALCGVRIMDKACNLYEKMISQGLKPKLTVYNSMIRAFCKLGNISEAQKYFEIMNKRRCEPDCATYTMLIHAYCSIQAWELAYELLMEMIGLGWNPHFDTYNLVDGLLKKNGRLDLSLKLERKMEVHNLCSHCKAGRLEAAYDKLSSMLAKGFYPPIYARDTFERAFQQSSKWKIARKLLDKMDQIIIQNNA